MEDEFVESTVETEAVAPEQNKVPADNKVKAAQTNVNLPMSTISIVLSIVAIFFGLLAKVLSTVSLVSTLVFLCLAIACIAASAVLYIIEIIQNKKVEFNVQIVLLILAILVC